MQKLAQMHFVSPYGVASYYGVIGDNDTYVSLRTVEKQWKTGPHYALPSPSGPLSPRDLN